MHWPSGATESQLATLPDSVAKRCVERVHHVCARARIRADENARGQALHLKSDGFKSSGEQRILFEAVTAAARIDETLRGGQRDVAAR